MQQQIQKPRKPEEKSSLLEDKINNASSQEDEDVVVIEYKTVELVYESCCGCGCSETRVRREVAGDSDLEDGDYVDDILEDDVILD